MKSRYAQIMVQVLPDRLLVRQNLQATRWRRWRSCRDSTGPPRRAWTSGSVSRRMRALGGRSSENTARKGTAGHVSRLYSASMFRFVSLRFALRQTFTAVDLVAVQRCPSFVIRSMRNVSFGDPRQKMWRARKCCWCHYRTGSGISPNLCAKGVPRNWSNSSHR